MKISVLPSLNLSSKDGNSWLLVSEMKVLLYLYMYYKYYENLGMDKKEIIKKIAKDRNVNKNEIYKQFI